MTTQDLRELRDQLHAELSGDSPIDPERRTLLLDVKAEIDELLARAAGTTELSVEDTKHLRGNLQSAAVGFESSHPQLASTLERAFLVLSNMGL